MLYLLQEYVVLLHESDGKPLAWLAKLYINLQK